MPPPLRYRYRLGYDCPFWNLCISWHPLVTPGSPRPTGAGASMFVSKLSDRFHTRATAHCHWRYGWSLQRRQASPSPYLAKVLYSKPLQVLLPQWRTLPLHMPSIVGPHWHIIRRPLSPISEYSGSVENSEWSLRNASTLTCHTLASHCSSTPYPPSTPYPCSHLHAASSGPPLSSWQASTPPVNFVAGRVIGCPDSAKARVRVTGEPETWRLQGQVLLEACRSAWGTTQSPLRLSLYGVPCKPRVGCTWYGSRLLMIPPLEPQPPQPLSYSVWLQMGGCLVNSYLKLLMEESGFRTNINYSGVYCGKRFSRGSLR